MAVNLGKLLNETMQRFGKMPFRVKDICQLGFSDVQHIFGISINLFGHLTKQLGVWVSKERRKLSHKVCANKKRKSKPNVSVKAIKVSLSLLLPQLAVLTTHTHTRSKCKRALLSKHDQATDCAINGTNNLSANIYSIIGQPETEGFLVSSVG